MINPQAVFHTLACGQGVFSNTINHSKSVRNHFTVKKMIKNGKKKQDIKELYSPLRCEEMSEMVSTDFFIIFFFTILYRLLDC